MSYNHGQKDIHDNFEHRGYEHSKNDNGHDIYNAEDEESGSKNAYVHEGSAGWSKRKPNGLYKTIGDHSAMRSHLGIIKPLSEASKVKLANYIKKATNDINYHAYDLGKEGHPEDSKITNRRTKGVNKAVDKLSGQAKVNAKESVINEISLEDIEANRAAAKAKWHYARAGTVKNASFKKGIENDYKAQLMKRGVIDHEGKQTPLKLKADAYKQVPFVHDNENAASHGTKVLNGVKFRKETFEPANQSMTMFPEDNLDANPVDQYDPMAVDEGVLDNTYEIDDKDWSKYKSSKERRNDPNYKPKEKNYYPNFRSSNVRAAEKMNESLPSHLQKFFDKDGTLKNKEHQADWDKKYNTPKSTIKDVTPKGYGPTNESSSHQQVIRDLMDDNTKIQRQIHTFGHLQSTGSYVHVRDHQIKQLKERQRQNHAKIKSLKSELK